MTIGLYIIIHNPIYLNPDHLTPILTKLCYLLATLDTTQKLEFALAVQNSIHSSYVKNEDKTFIFQQTITLLQQFLTLRLVSAEQRLNSNSIDDDASIHAIQSLALLCIYFIYLASINESNNFVPFYEFYNQSVEEKLDLKEDYPKWKGREG
jgi:hypothetical protein